ncbi:MAG: hypothetical protein N2505_05955 [Endomicrobia bacterium]|nr:hypothetical protein [Endomicrobiia bacterium]
MKNILNMKRLVFLIIMVISFYLFMISFKKACYNNKIKNIGVEQKIVSENITFIPDKDNIKNDNLDNRFNLFIENLKGNSGCSKIKKNIDCL